MFLHLLIINRCDRIKGLGSDITPFYPKGPGEALREYREIKRGVNCLNRNLTGVFKKIIRKGGGRNEVGSCRAEMNIGEMGDAFPDKFQPRFGAERALVFRNDKKVKEFALLRGGLNKVQVSAGKGIAVCYDCAGLGAFCLGDWFRFFKRGNKLLDPSLFIFH